MTYVVLRELWCVVRVSKHLGNWGLKMASDSYDAVEM
jgi:hypothetical protein